MFFIINNFNIIIFIIIIFLLLLISDISAQFILYYVYFHPNLLWNNIHLIQLMLFKQIDSTSYNIFYFFNFNDKNQYFHKKYIKYAKKYPYNISIKLF